MKSWPLLLLFACSAAWAVGQAAPVEALPVCRLDPHDNTLLAVEPCATAPPVQARRAVPQVIGRMPVTRMTPPVLASPTVPPATHAPVPGMPLPLNSCDSGGCRDASGMRHDGSVGNASLDANGRVCHRNGAFLQCF